MMERPLKLHGLIIAFLYCILVILYVECEPGCRLGGFDAQAGAVLRLVRLPPPRLRQMQRLAEHLEQLLQTLWPGSTVLQFGSTMTGMALQGSDIDCFVSIPNKDEFEAQDTALASAAQTLLANRPEFKKIHFKRNIDEPILSFEYAPTRISVDLSVSTSLGAPTALLLARLLSLDKRILQLAIIIKYWSYIHGLSGNRFVFPSFSITLLVIFYLQQQNILPSISSLQENAEPVMIHNWNSAFTFSENYTEFDESLYDLLGGFFKYYSAFNYEDVMSPYCGCVLKREQMQDMDLPEEFSLYRRNFESGLAVPFPFGPLNVQDVFAMDDNAARHWIDKSAGEKLVLLMKRAAEKFEKLGSDRFLLTILETRDRHKDLLKKLWSDKGILDSCVER